MNMSQQDDSQLKRAAQYWNSGQPLEAGEVIFESLPIDARPKWASRILRLVLARSGIQPSRFEVVLHTADHRTLWGNGHRVFDTLRVSVLKLEAVERWRTLTDEESLRISILSLAELVAKVVYNATDPPDEFDLDSGWWIAVSLKDFVDWWKDEEFSKAAWSALCSWE